jgi:hypothetical protein
MGDHDSYSNIVPRFKVGKHQWGETLGSNLKDSLVQWIENRLVQSFRMM